MNLQKLDLNLLKVFDVLMDERNVSRAAERLALSQPAVSGALTRLRDSLGDPLFVRTQHGMTPTMKATELAAPLKRLLNELAIVLESEKFVPEQAEMVLSIAGTDYSLSVIILPLIERLKKLAPGIKVSARFIRDELVQQQMEKGELDIALMTPDTAPEGLRGKTLFTEDYVCVMGKNNPLAKLPVLTLDDFCKADHAIVSYLGGAFSGATDKALASLGFQRNVTISVPSFLILLDLVKKTSLIAVVPSRLVTNSTDLHVTDLPILVQGFTKYMVWHERTHHHQAYQWLREQVASISYA
ncbi:LysR family transcriptional regulator [Rheinheimera texasensis]|uniref:LysR family transcriptional regulator n=1 Tax=Rheinheimera texasensis TaxID=306205 RepID=UPI0004E10351|nr:LysR family transcriptional regulator [Rheinheimera texasensis]